MSLWNQTVKPVNFRFVLYLGWDNSAIAMATWRSFYEGLTAYFFFTAVCVLDVEADPGYMIHKDAATADVNGPQSSYLCSLIADRSMDQP